MNTRQKLSQEAIARARSSLVAAELGYRHTKSEATNDPAEVATTLDSEGPYAWSIPIIWAEDGTAVYFPASTSGEEPHWSCLLATDPVTIRGHYENFRGWLDYGDDWENFWEIRQNWYLAFHGSGTSVITATGETTQIETVAVVPVGRDGILGEMHFGIVGTDRTNRWPDVPAVPGEVPAPVKRIEARELHDRYLQALRDADIEGILACHRPDSSLCIRDYVSPGDASLTIDSPEEFRRYYTDFFARYQVHNVEIVHRMVDTWYAFAELFWRVEERSGERRLLEFCTAEVSPIDANCKLWTRNGSGTVPVVSDGGELPYAFSRLEYRRTLQQTK